MLSRQNQGGRSMIEMLGVLGIMAVITVLSIAAYTMAMRNIKVNNAKSDVAIIAQKIRSLFPNNDYEGLASGCDDVQDGLDMFKEFFIDTGLMKKTNAFGIRDMSEAGYPEAGYGVGHGYCPPKDVDDKSVFTINVWCNDDEECSLLKAQNWGDDTEINDLNIIEGYPGVSITFTD